MRCIAIVITAVVGFGLVSRGPVCGQDHRVPAEPGLSVQALTGEQVLSRMTATYAACKTYQDEGEVKILFDTSIGKWTDSRPFTTAFVRPNKFRYEFSSKVGPMGIGPLSRYVVWADGEDIRSWWTLQPHVQTHPSIEDSIAGPSGVSGGSASMIPPLLIPMGWSAGLDRLTKPRVVAEERVDGAECYKVEGQDISGETTSLWVDKQAFLLRKVFAKRKVKDFTTEETTTYKPKTDAVIPDSTFEFTPPEK